MKPFNNIAVSQTFDGYPLPIRRKLLALRELIFQVATAERVGEIEETLKWSEPAYLTKHLPRTRTRSGSTIRLGWKQTKPTSYAMYFNCQTTLVESFRMMFPEDFSFEGNRAIVFSERDPVPKDALRVCIAAALTYHQHRPHRPKVIAK